jgi:hypothetical protein
MIYTQGIKFENYIIMGFIHKGTGIKFENRKQAVILMGQTRYNKFLKNNEFIFLSDNKE